MKMALFLFCLLFCTAAFAQYLPGGGATVSTEPYIPSSPNHPAHASYAPMAEGQNILGAGSYPDHEAIAVERRQCLETRLHAAGPIAVVTPE